MARPNRPHALTWFGALLPNIRGFEVDFKWTCLATRCSSPLSSLWADAKTNAAESLGPSTGSISSTRRIFAQQALDLAPEQRVRHSGTDPNAPRRLAKDRPEVAVEIWIKAKEVSDIDLGRVAQVRP